MTIRKKWGIEYEYKPGKWRMFRRKFRTRAAARLSLWWMGCDWNHVRVVRVGFATKENRP